MRCGAITANGGEQAKAAEEITHIAPTVAAFACLLLAVCVFSRGNEIIKMEEYEKNKLLSIGTLGVSQRHYCVKCGACRKEQYMDIDVLKKHRTTWKCKVCRIKITSCKRTPEQKAISLLINLGYTITK